MAGHQDQTGSHGGTSNRGFASTDEKKQRDIASKGGHSVPDEERSFSKDRELAAEAGKKGGQARGGAHASSRTEEAESDTHGDKRGGAGNFANDRERASEAGRKGGEH